MGGSIEVRVHKIRLIKYRHVILLRHQVSTTVGYLLPYHLRKFEVNQKSVTLFPGRPKLANLNDSDGHVTKPVYNIPTETSRTVICH